MLFSAMKYLQKDEIQYGYMYSIQSIKQRKARVLWKDA